MDNLTQFVLLMPVLLFSVVCHEYAHGYAALRQGDPTAYQLGRLTLNPIKHIDPFMTILLPALLWFTAGFILGGAKPVPVNPRNYRNFKRGDIIVSLAGVATNVVLAFISAALIPIAGIIGTTVQPLAGWMSIVQFMLVFGIQINLILAAFNLLPIPPLDGSHVMKYLLPPAWSLKYQAVGAYGMFILIALLMFARPVLWAWLTPALLLGGALRSIVGAFMLPLLLPW